MTTDEWLTVPLGSVAKVTRGASPRPIASPRWFSPTSKVGWVRISDLSRSDGRLLLETTQRLSADGIARSRYLEPGTLIMSIAATVGVPIVTGIPACIHDGFVALEDLTVDQTYLLYRLKASQSQLRAAGQSGSQSNLNSAIVKGLSVFIPSSRPEQEQIADALSSIDDLVSSLRKLISKKRGVKLGVLQQLLSVKTRLAGFDDDWKLATLGELGVFVKGRGVKRDDVRSAGVPCIRYGELYTSFSDYTASTRSFVSQAVASTAQPIQSGDILFAGSGETKTDIGKSVAYVGDVSAVAGGDIVILRGSGFDPVFLSTLLNTSSIAAQKARAGQGDAVVHISAASLGAIELRVPGLPEQKAIGELIRDFDHEIETLIRRLTVASAIREGMSQELLSARTRLPKGVLI